LWKKPNPSLLKKMADNKMEMRGYTADIFKDDCVYLRIFKDSNGLRKELIYPIEEN